MTCNLQYLLSYGLLCITWAHAWDIAVTSANQIELYANQTKIHNEGERFEVLTVLAFDAVNNMLLFADVQSNASISSYNPDNKKFQTLVNGSYKNIQGLAFDPVEGILFWTDINEKGIYHISLNPGSKNDASGSLLIKMGENPTSIAVDSCRGYIYWINSENPSIERARFDGSEREVVVYAEIYKPVSLIIDQNNKRLFWADTTDEYYSIESSDLEGGKRKRLLKGKQYQPKSLTVSKDYIYWIDLIWQSVMRLPKNATGNLEPTELITSFAIAVPFGIAANYPIEEQIKGIPQCESIQRLMSQSASNASAEISYCYNYCFEGNCSLAVSGEPSCRCKDGYSGLRCEVEMCRGHCLNFGTCSLNKDKEPVCSCPEHFEGSRCETKKELPRPQEIRREKVILCNCTKENTTLPANMTRPEPQSKEPVYGTSEPSYSMDVVIRSGCVTGDPMRNSLMNMIWMMCALVIVASIMSILMIINPTWLNVPSRQTSERSQCYQENVKANNVGDLL